jgi:hypothetical protein
MATVTCTPSEARVGEEVVVEGKDFTPSTLATMTIKSPNGNQGIYSSEANTDASGEVATVDQANFAAATLTLTGNAVAAETVTIGAVTYTFRTSVSTTANEVLIGATASATLDNLKSAINLDGSAVYGSATVVHPTVHAGAKTATTLVLSAKTGGTGGNSLASTETMTNGSFGGATFANGAAVTAIDPFHFVPSVPGVYTVSVSDGTLSASTTLKVWASS